MGGLRIYVVEDEAFIAVELEEELERLGYEICGHAASGEVALEELPALRPDVILLDVCLGSGLSGLDVAEAIREHVDAPIIFLTAYSDTEVVERAMRSGSFAFIIKPFHPQMLRANIELAFGKFSAERRLREAHDSLSATAESLRARSRDLDRALSLQQATLDAADSGFLIVEGATIRAANRQLFALWGIEEGAPEPVDGDLLERLCARLVDPRALLREAPAGEDADVIELRDGRLLERRSRPRLLRGEVVGRVLSFRDVTRERRATTALREGRARLRRIVDNIADGVVVAHADGRVAFANPRFAELIAAPVDRVDALRLDDFVDPEWRGIVRQRHEALLAGAEPSAPLSFRARRCDGTSFWAEADVVPVRDADGSIVGTQSALRDVTVRKETNEALRLLSTGVAHLRGDALLCELTRELARLLEVEIGFVGALSPRQQTPRTIALWIDGEEHPGDELDLDALPLAELGAGGVVCTSAGAKLQRALPRVTIGGAALAPLMDVEGRLIGVLGVASRAPLEGARVEALLGLFAVLSGARLEQQHEEDKLRDLFEYSPDAVMIADRDGEIIMANRRAHDLLGYDRGKNPLVGRAIEDLVPEELRAGHVQARARFRQEGRQRSLGTLEAPLRALRSDGTRIPVDVSLGPLLSAGDQLVVVVVRDLSQHLRAEEERTSLELQLRQAQKMDALGTLAGGIAHDFNNILGAIVANVELAKAALDDRERARRHIEDLGVAAERATLLVRQILAFGRRQPPTRTRTSLAPLIGEVTRLLRATLPARIAIDLSIEADAPAVLVDTTQIHQVLMNLGTNASHAIASTGVISFGLDSVAASPTRDSSRRLVRLEVRDTGRGMDIATLERVCEPFFTTKPQGEGAGLGLSVVHGIIAEHGGELTITSEVGRGTTVTILLPAEVDGAIEEVAAPDEPDCSAGDDLRILLIDDDPVLVTVGEALLTELGYAVTASTDSTEAVARVTEAPDDFDIILTDCNMPGISGVELARQLAIVAPKLPVVLVSGYTGCSDDELDAAGIRYRLDKPYTLRTLDQVLCEVRGALEAQREDQRAGPQQPRANDPSTILG